MPKILRARNVIIFLLLVLLLIIAGTFVIKSALKRYYPLKYIETIFESAEKHGIEPDIILAVIHTESKFNEKAVSSKGAIGLMQITPDTLEWAAQKDKEPDDILGIEALIDPELNIKYGTLILSFHLKEFGDLKTALCAYNAGRSNAKKWLKDKRYSKDSKTIDVIPIKETDEYVKRVYLAKEVYKKLYNDEINKRNEVIK